MAYLNSFKNKELYYSCKDMPSFIILYVREFAAFKWFFWVKTYLQFPGFAKRKFKFSDYPEELFAIGSASVGTVQPARQHEIWNIESMSIFFRQIEFYRDAEMFESDKDLYIV